VNFMCINWGKRRRYAKIEVVEKVIPNLSFIYTEVVHRFF
jgi:hypothetical protein